MAKALVEGQNAAKCEVCGELVSIRQKNAHKIKHLEAATIKSSNTAQEGHTVVNDENKAQNNVEDNAVKAENKAQICKPLSLTAESDRLKDKIEPKPEAKTVYKCGGCGAVLAGKVKFCSDCGVELDG